MYRYESIHEFEHSYVEFFAINGAGDMCPALVSQKIVSPMAQKVDVFPFQIHYGVAIVMCSGILLLDFGQFLVSYS